jgi:CIC family chloride channel protein
MTERPTPKGFDQLPARPAWFTAVLFVVVIVASATFAKLFRRTSYEVISRYADADDPTGAANRLSPWIVFLVVSAAVALAAVLGHIVQRRWGDRVGIEAVAATARGENVDISFRATGTRVAGTWLATTGVASIGRESAIIETGGAIGSLVARRTGGRGATMASAGMAAAFAAAYHAPIAAILYLEEHLGVSKSRRAITFSVAGAIGGYAVSRWMFGIDPIFPPIEGSHWESLPAALVGLLPAVLVARLFLQLRVRFTCAALARLTGGRHWWHVAGLSLVAGASVAIFPSAAGNGMEGLGEVAAGATFTIGFALLIGKLLGTAAALGSGAPGGVITPTIAMSSGAALVAILTARELGMQVDHVWDSVVLVMAVGVAVGIRAPLMAVFLVPEMMGDYWLVPVAAVVVVIALGVDRVLDIAIRRAGGIIPTGVRDEDA